MTPNPATNPATNPAQHARQGINHCYYYPQGNSRGLPDGGTGLTLLKRHDP
jgi:hypothetical protein